MRKGKKIRIINLVFLLSVIAIYSPIVTSGQSHRLMRGQTQKIRATEAYTQKLVFSHSSLLYFGFTKIKTSGAN